MEKLKGMRFVTSFSGGKDSILAMHRAVGAGLEPHSLITAQKIGSDKSWAHSMGPDLLKKVSDSLGIPLNLIETTGESYAENIEKALLDARSKGAQVCVFGDIDLMGHYEWCSKRCEKAGIIPCFPLWMEERKKVVYEFINHGYSAIIRTVDKTRMSERFLGRILTKETADEIERYEVDICGENGEYHTFVYDGPLFAKKVVYTINGRNIRDKYVSLQLG